MFLYGLSTRDTRCLRQLTEMMEVFVHKSHPSAEPDFAFLADASMMSWLHLKDDVRFMSRRASFIRHWTLYLTILPKLERKTMMALFIPSASTIHFGLWFCEQESKEFRAIDWVHQVFLCSLFTVTRETNSAWMLLESPFTLPWSCSHAFTLTTEKSCSWSSKSWENKVDTKAVRILLWFYRFHHSHFPERHSCWKLRQSVAHCLYVVIKTNFNN